MAGVDVVIVGFNNRESLPGCVAPLLGAPDVNVIVVDNASPDRCGDVVADLPVTLVRAAENRGFGAGCNLGSARGSSPYVLFLNPDAQIDTAGVRALAGVLESDVEVGIVGPRIIDESGRLDHSIRRFPRLRSTLGQALFLHRLGGAWADEIVRDGLAYEEARDADWLSGACLMARRSLLEQLDGFDEGFFLYCEDTDICRRAWASGYRVRYVSTATAVHGGGGSAPRSALLPVLAESRVRYASLHAPRAAKAERLAVALGELTHAAVGRGPRAARAGHLAAAARALRT